jgi:hypothetical protein
MASVLVMACGNQQQPEPATPTTSAPPAATSAAPAASESSAPVASAAPEPTASATPPPPALTKTVKQIVGDAKIIKLTWRENMSSNDAKTVTIRAAPTLRAIVDAIGADQTPTGTPPSYMSTFTFRFEDAKENPLATISLYASDTLPDSAKKYGRIDTADGSFAAITVAKYDELQKKLKSLGVTLP